MKYLTKIKDKQVIIEIERIDDRFNVIVNNEMFLAEMFQLDGTDTFLFLINNQPYETEITKKNHQYFVSFNGGNYLCGIEDEQLARLRHSIRGSEKVHTEHVLNTPMPGLIVNVNVIAGQKVNKGERLLTIEAMKMENEIAAPEDAIVKKVNVEPKQAVELGQELMVLKYQK